MSQTVLVADDSKTIRQIVEMALKASSWEVVGVESAQDAMQAARQIPAVILLDYYMPDGSGYDVCRALKQDSDTRTIPIVMLGGSYKAFDEALAKQAGADFVLMKPFKTDALLDALQEAQNAEAALPLPTMPASEPSEVEIEAEPDSEPEVASEPNMLSLDSDSEEEVEYGYGMSEPSMEEESSEPVYAMPEPVAAPDPEPVHDVSDRFPAGDDSDELPIPEPSGLPRTPTEPARGSSPDINASSRAPVAPTPMPAAAPGITRDEIEIMIREEVKTAVKNELPGLLRNVMGEIFQQKIMPKLTEHADARINQVVNEQLATQIQTQVRAELERLLSED